MSDQLFFGREAEQNRFRGLLKEILDRSKRNEKLPTVILLYGQGGIGKTTLAKRFRQIADDEFKGQVQTFFIGWEEELERDPRLRVGRDNIEPETVYDALHKAIIREQPPWRKHFKEYVAFLKQYHQVQEVISTTINQHDDLRDLSSLGANILAKLLAASIPIPQPLSDPLEKVSVIILGYTIQAGAEQVAKLRKRLRERLNDRQYELLLRPREQMSRAIGQGLAQLGKERPFILLLDTYELVDGVDFWIRDAIKAAGPRLIWVISGRHNLWNSGMWGGKLFKGYDDADGESYSVTHYDMQELAAEDIESFFATAVPERPITSDQLESIQQVTMGVPLAVRTAADIFKETGRLEDVVGRGERAIPGEDIIQVMIGRLLHVVGQQDQYLERKNDEETLCAVALADGDETLLQAMLAPEDSQEFDLDSYLDPLERKYASVFRKRMKLHDESYIYFRNHLRLKWKEKWVRRHNERATDVLEENLEKLRRLGLVSLEAQCKDEDWVRTTLRLTDHYFWVDEEKGWRWLVPRFIESLVYNHDMREGLLEVVGDWQPTLSSFGKRRLELLRATPRLSFPLLSRYSLREQDEEDLLDNLKPLVEEFDWLGGDGELERRAIWDMLWGETAFREAVYQQESPNKAGEILTQALQGLPKYGQKLRERLAQDFTVLGDYDAFPATSASNYEKAIQCNPEYVPALIGLGLQYSYLGQSDQATEVYQRAIDLLTEIEILPVSDSARQNLATALNNLAEEHYFSEQFEEALVLFRKARDLTPQNSITHAGIGDMYANLGDIEQAIAAYKTAIEHDPDHVRCYLTLAVMFRQQGNVIEFAHQLEQARQVATPDWLANEWDPFNRACFAAVVDDDIEKALELLEQSFKLYPGLRARARHEPAFHFIEHDPRFFELVGG